MCRRCGKIVDPGDNFCISCGTDLRLPSASGQPVAVDVAAFRASLHTPLPRTDCTSSSGRPSPDGSLPVPPPPRHFPPEARPVFTGTAGAYSAPPVPYRIKSTDPLAVFSLVCGLVGFLIPLLPSAAAVAAGCVSRRRIRYGDDVLEGESLAQAGIWLGVAGLVLDFLLLLIILATVLTP